MDDLPIKEGELLAIKRCRISEFRGALGINCNASDEMYTTQELLKIKECWKIMKWYKSEFSKGDITVVNISEEGDGQKADNNIPTMTLHQGVMTNADIFFVHANLFTVVGSERSVYPSCPNCKKKMTSELGDNAWSCVKCDKNYDNPVYRYIINFQISDGTSSLWCTSFNEEAQTIVGDMTAEEYHSILNQDTHTEEERKNLLKVNQFKRYKFIIKHIEDTYQGEMRHRYTAIKVYNDSPKNDNKALLKILHAYQSDDNIDKLNGLSLKS